MKRIIGLLSLFLVLNATFSNPVQKQDLIRLAVNAYQQKQTVAGFLPEAKIQDCRFVVEQSDTLLLIVNFPKGFIVMSADDAIMPVLAYSLDQQLETDNVAPAAQQWLDYYAAQVRYVKNRHVNPSSNVVRQWEALNAPKSTKDEADTLVEPLLTALWNQTKYYNAYSPIDMDAPHGYDNRTPNGCVAVAMAMIMYYYRYPSHGIGSHTNSNDYGDFYVDFGQATYYYEAMKDNIDYYNNEVAKLIYHCATAVDMWYGADGSGASSEAVPNALVSYFGFDPSCEILSRHDHSLRQWKSYIKTELDAKRPVYYSGCSDEGCHAFVCDGYENDEYYHFNFGWGGSSNGYYVLRATEDDSVVIDGYSHSQRIVRYIFPPVDNYPSYCSEKGVVCESGTLEDGSGYLDYANNSDCMFYITEDQAYRFQIIVKAFDTQADHDSLSFWDGHPDQGNLLQTLSGRPSTMPTYYFDADTLYITFKTDASVTGSGWLLQYKVARHQNPCGTTSIIQNYHGTLTDGSGDAKYRSNANCFWRLDLPMASYILMDFPLMDIAAGDQLTIYDGSVYPREKLMDFTVSSTPVPQMFYTNQLIFTFMSDNYLNGDGFELHWTSDYSPEGIEAFTSEDIHLFPNPASETVCITLPASMQDVGIFLYDVSGRLVGKSLEPDATKVDLDVSSLPNGFYMLVVQGDNGSVKKKMIIQH